MKAILIEDEYPAAERLEKLIKKIDEEIEIVAVLDSIESSKRLFSTHPAPDLIFSDIQLSDGLSFAIFESMAIPIPIIFTTSYDEYAIKAFKVKSIDYLLKPIKPQELEAAIMKFKESQRVFSANDYTLKIQSLLDSMPAVGRKHKTCLLYTSRCV